MEKGTAHHSRHKIKPQAEKRVSPRVDERRPHSTAPAKQGETVSGYTEREEVADLLRGAPSKQRKRKNNQRARPWTGPLEREYVICSHKKGEIERVSIIQTLWT